MAFVQSKKRKLPDWMTNRESIEPLTTIELNNDSDHINDKTSSTGFTNMQDKPGRILPPSFYEGFSDAKLPFLKYNGRIVYSCHSDECNFICESLMASENQVMGFDMEWRVTFIKGGGSRKTALIQLCPVEDTCYLFQLSRMTGFPVALKSLLEHEKILKAGVGIQSDIEKISQEFDVNPTGLVDLSVLANQKLKSKENWRLTGLVMNLFKCQLNKDNSVRCSNWEAIPLSHEQKMYAATDAYAGLIIYKKLTSIKYEH